MLARKNSLTKCRCQNINWQIPAGSEIILIQFKKFYVPFCSSFNDSNHYQREDEGPIDEDTIVVLDTQTGQMLASWGGSQFYMPHGITIDSNNSIWLTDVALHQVFKVIQEAIAETYIYLYKCTLHIVTIFLELAESHCKLSLNFSYIMFFYSSFPDLTSHY